ncbi:TonB-dependent receptor domain-containing protein [Roseateles sp.]|uniref:TonB-dependent receptor domain-containing protein n=1 Tax=Roseateles sp. TaxID=1971397 RepID=UPI003D0F5C7D
MTSSVRPQARTQARASLSASAASTSRLSSITQRSLPFALTALAALSQAPVQAQTTAMGPSKLSSVVVTATRSKLDLNQVLADVTVLTRADIERQGFGNLADLLSRQSCVEIVRNGNPGSSTSLFTRGANTQHTLLLVDGVRMDTQGGSGGPAWEAIPLSMIERIEIVRGAASSVYGSDAVAGVVQVFTRKSTGKPLVDIGAAIGSLGTVKADFNASGLLGDFDYAFGLANEYSEGFNIRKVSNDPAYTPDIDDWRNYSLNARLGYQLNRQHRVELVNTSAATDAAYDASAKPKAGVSDRNLHRTQITRALWSAQWNADLQTELSQGVSTERYETQTNKASTYLTETRVRQTALSGSYKLGASLGQINGLLERRSDELVNSGLRKDVGGRADRHQDAVALAYLLSLGSVDFQLHARHDDDSDFGGTNTGTVATGWRFASGWRAWASAGTAFRAPTLYQIFSEYGPKPGVAALSPERGRNSELGLNYSNGDSELGLTVYNNRIRDLITWDSGFAANCISTFGGCYGNLAKVTLRGVSLQGETRFAGLRLQGSLDWQDPRDVGTDKILGRRSRTHGTLRVEKTLDQWTAGAQVQANGKRFDDHANKKPMGGYALLNLDAGYRINKQLRVQINLDNALNKSYETAQGYAQAPRTVLFSLRYSSEL